MKKVIQKKEKLLKEIEQHYNTHKNAIRIRLMEFKSIPASEYFYELAYCLLTPQSRAAHAELVITELRTAGFHKYELDPEPALSNKDHYIRFHKTKTRHLIEMKKQYPLIVSKISEELPAFELRDWLVKNVLGLGYKEATHFLRNIGKNDNLAILDRHILRSLKGMNIIRFIPKSLSRRYYLSIEQRLIEFSENTGITLDELDLTLWSMGTGEIRK